MKFIVYEIDGDKLLKDIKSWQADDLGGNAPFKWSDTVEAGYAELTSIEEIHAYGFNNGKDYKFVRDKIKELVIAKGSDEETGFTACTAAEKLIACEHKIGTHDQRVAEVGLDNVVALGLQYHSRVSEVRTKRLAYAIAEVHNMLPDNAEEIIDDTNVDNLIFQYVFFGREGVDEGDTIGIMDYIFGRTGTNYDGTGLLQKSWTPESGTMQELCDKIEKIVINGEY